MIGLEALIVLGIAARYMAWLWVESEFFGPLHDRISNLIYTASEDETEGEGFRVWLNYGFNCDICTTQWMAFLVYSLVVAAPWNWGMHDVVSTVGVGGVGVTIAQIISKLRNES